MENKIGEVDSKISYDDYKVAVNYKNKSGFYSIAFIALLFVVSGLIVAIFSPGWIFIKYLLLIAGSIILLFFLMSLTRIKKGFKLLEENGDTSSRYEFYEDHIYRSNETSTSTISYDKFVECYENAELIMDFTDMNRVVILKKADCNEQILEKLRNAITDEKKKKLKKKKSGLIIFMAVEIICTVLISIMAIVGGKPKADYPYATYESFIGCAEEGNVEDVIVYKNKISFKFTGYEEDQYFNVSVKENMDEVIDKLDELHVNWRYD